MRADPSGQTTSLEGRRPVMGPESAVSGHPVSTAIPRLQDSGRLRWGFVEGFPLPANESRSEKW